MTAKECMQILPDIEMYGGDTTPWEYQIKHDDGSDYTSAEVSDYTATLYVLPYYMQTGVSISGSPVLTKSATFSAVNGCAVAVFSLAIADTLTLGGKYIYQVEFAYGTAKRVGQGNLYVRPNLVQTTQSSSSSGGSSSGGGNVEEPVPEPGGEEPAVEDPA